MPVLPLGWCLVRAMKSADIVYDRYGSVRLPLALQRRHYSHAKVIPLIGEDCRLLLYLLDLLLYQLAWSPGSLSRPMRLAALYVSLSEVRPQ